MNTRQIAQTLQLLIAGESHFKTDDILVQQYSDKPDLAVLKTLDGYFKQQQSVPDFASDSFAAFILSKPEASTERLLIHAFQPLGQGGNTNGELWLKMKSRLAVDTLFGNDVRPSPSAPELQAQLFKLLGVALDFHAQAEVLEQGPQWVETDVEFQVERARLKLSLPVLETPIHVPPRFAGHYYVKLLTDTHSALNSL